MKLAGLHIIKNRNGRVRYYYRPGRGTKDEVEHRNKWRAFPANIAASEVENYYRSIITGEADLELSRLKKYARNRACYYKSRARQKGLEYSLSPEAIAQMFEYQKGRCCISGIAFDLGGREMARPFAPSLDRIDPRRGYTLDNVRLVCRIVNMALNVWGKEALDRLVLEMARRSRFVL